jgi:hypothetical protein
LQIDRYANLSTAINPFNSFVRKKLTSLEASRICKKCFSGSKKKTKNLRAWKLEYYFMALNTAEVNNAEKYWFNVASSFPSFLR